MQRVVGSGLVGAKRHVRDDEGALDGPRHRSCQGDQLVHRDRQGRVVAEDGVAGGVADEEKVDARLVEDLRG